MVSMMWTAALFELPGAVNRVGGACLAKTKLRVRPCKPASWKSMIWNLRQLCPTSEFMRRPGDRGPMREALLEAAAGISRLIEGRNTNWRAGCAHSDPTD